MPPDHDADSPPRSTIVAAVDVGSNALRLAIARAGADGNLEVIERRRQPLRLGTDAFRLGRFRPETIDAAVAHLRSFRRHIDEHDAATVLAVATSATRAAANGAELARRARTEAGLDLRIIDAGEEADLALLAVESRIDLGSGPALLIDMGGGSIEVTLARAGRRVRSASLDLGPVRVLERLRADGAGESAAAALAREAAAPVRELVGPEAVARCVGTGGNLECLGRSLAGPLLGRTPSDVLGRKDLEALGEKLVALPVEQRITELGLAPDRADLIAVAAIVLHAIVAAARVDSIIIPGVGLIEGVLRRAARESAA